MKLGFLSTVKSLFNVKSWLGWNNLVQNGVWIRKMYTGLSKQYAENPVKETFEQACQRYGYSADFLKSQELQFSQAATLYLVMLGFGILYMSWLLVKQKLMAFFVMIPLNFMLFAFYFRESFWLMQIRQKRLGMNFKDWLNIVVLQNGKKH